MASLAQPSRDRQDTDSDAVIEEIEIIEEIPSRPLPKMIPDLFTQPPPVRDALETPTSAVQDETVQECHPFLAGEDEFFEYNEHGVPRLLRPKHITFLHNSLKALPSKFVAADASRPWFLYWCLEGLATLGEDVTTYRDAIAATARSMQNESGGFGGGGKQLSHLATTYAVVLSLALVGGKDAFELIDRRAMWKWLCTLKQPDGGFQVCLGGEEDIRGAFCASVVITLLNIPLDLTPDSPAYNPDRPGDLFTGIGEYVHRCQTFEGGISAQPGAEAHGAYAFCALGVLSILDLPSRTITRHLDVPRLISWLSSRQYAPEGGFSGRTNKLVDGCYSHWVGACFPLIEAALEGPSEDSKHGFPAVSESLFHREGLIRYILCCGQDQTKRGGLRDKPGKMSDPYHTCYVLSGLSSAQHQWKLCLQDESSISDAPCPAWKVLPYPEDTQIFDRRDRVYPIHPVYAIPQEKQEAARDYFLAKEGF